MATSNKHTERMNEEFANLMDQLAGIMMKHGEPFRARAYQKAQESIITFPDTITHPQQLKGRPAIGTTIMEKLTEYMETGTLSVLENEKTNPVTILSDVYGIGPKKAQDLVKNGITTIEQLRENQHLLNNVQLIGLKYYEDVLQRIPRDEIELYKNIFETNFPYTDHSKFEIVGSYRRGANSSGDIDVIITSNDNTTFNTFIQNLMDCKLILHILSKGPTKCLVMAKLPQSNTVRRVDFLYTSLEEFPFAILYFTGSKLFNTAMRHIALKNGYTMNEHGICNKTGAKVGRTFKTEKDIFDFLNMEFKAPHERIDGNSVIVKNETKKKIIIIDDCEEDCNNTNTNTNNAVTNDKCKNENASDNDITHILQSFKKNGVSYLDSLDESVLTHLLKTLNRAYYNEKELLPDCLYDIIKDFVKSKYPANAVHNEVGAEVETVDVPKAELPYYMGSMDKIKADTDALNKWKQQYNAPYVISCKLDGVSALYSTEGPEPKLYTRGNGRVGLDISHIIPYLSLPQKKGITLRGELIVNKTLFEHEYSKTFKNVRNMVAGAIKRKTLNPKLVRDIHFVCYEVMMPVLSVQKQFQFMRELKDVKTVFHILVSGITNEYLSEELLKCRNTYQYDIDGLIVSSGGLYERKMTNPEHAFAFKMVLNDQLAEVIVTDVQWSASKDGYLKPRVIIEPVQLCGVTIEAFTGFNASFIYNNKIGVGTILEVIRSGDVIPHIRKVIQSSDEPRMPNVPYIWNSTHVDIIVQNMEENEEVLAKNLTRFFVGIGVEGLSLGNINRIIDAGYNSIPHILTMEKEDFLKVNGFKDKMATKLYGGIREKIASASLLSIMSSSNIFGRGFSEKRLELIMEHYPTILLINESREAKINKVASIKGMATKTATAFVDKIPEFIHFMKQCKLVSKLAPVENNTTKSAAVIGHPLFGKSVVFTGQRDGILMDDLKKIGVNLGSAVSSKTFAVVASDINQDTGKASDARKLNIPIYTPQLFREKFLS
jgi:DNA ligase (NAD+)